MPLLNKLYLLRHGLANALEPGAFSDDDRVLSPEGIARVTAAAGALQRLRVSPEAVWTSPLPRALQTARIVTQALGLAEPIEREELRIGADGQALLEALGGAKLRRLMLVGHNPDLQELAAVLIGARGEDALTLSKGGLAQLKLHAAPGPRSARLVSLWREKDLIRLAEPTVPRGRSRKRD